MTDVEQLLAAEFEELGRRAPHDPDLAGSVRRRARRQGAVLGSVAAAVLVLAGSALVVATRDGAPAPAAGPGRLGPVSCVVERGPLPEWARTGFSGDGGGIPFVRSQRGSMLAILFGYPLTAPPRDRANNKILWVEAPRTVNPSPSDADWTLRIEARLGGSDLVVRKDVAPAPGPSIVDLPQPGCWQVDVRWGPFTDRINLPYEPRPATS